MKSTKPLLIGALLAIFTPAHAEQTTPTEMTVYRSPTCGCCGNWEQHVKDNKFSITDNISDDMQAIKQKYGVPEQLSSCHTAIVGGYVIEGHVPAKDIEKLLREKPDVVGITAPGMPMGSPGMEMGPRKDDYQVLSFDKNGNVKVFAEHGPGK